MAPAYTAVVALGALLGGAAASAASATPPNIIFILADDLDSDWKQDHLAIMPNLRDRIRGTGAHFVNHVAAQPVCGPSRTSMLQGRYPHNVGYKANLDQPSVDAYFKIANNTIGSWFTAAGYHTAYLGKYVNGLYDTVPSGWNHWGGFSSSKGTYNYYNATIWNVTFDDAGQHPISPIVDVAMTGVHQADFLGQLAVAQMGVAQQKQKPFFVHLTPVMVHEGTCLGPFKDPSQYAPTDPYWEQDLAAFGCTDPAANEKCSMTMSPCPTERHAHAADGLVNPHVPSWNATVAGVVPAYMTKKWPAMTAYEAQRQDMGFRNRTASAMDLDDMVGVVLDGLEALGPAVASNTYVIFTSDNGFHLGEHRMVFGKEHPYNSDVLLPFYIKGPGIPANVSLLHPTTHVDTTATLVELGGLTPQGPPLDGLSFAAALTATPVVPAAWRNFSFTEHFSDLDTWVKIRYPLAPAPGAADKEDAARMAFHYWCKNTSEVFDLVADPWELTNLAGATPPVPHGDKVAEETLKYAVFLSTCSGAACSAPTKAHVPKQPLPCYTTNKTLSDEFEYDT